MKKAKTILDYVLMLFWGIIFVFMVSIAARFLTRQICIDILHWDNSFTRFVFMGEEKEITGSERYVDRILDEGKIADWEKRYPFQETSITVEDYQEIKPASKITDYMANLKNKINKYTDDLLIGRHAAATIASYYNKSLGFANMETDVVYLTNGHLVRTQEQFSQQDIKEMADSVAGFSQYLNSLGVDFLYVNIGSKINPYDKQLPQGEADFSNENCDSLITELENRNVHVYDIREQIRNEIPDWYSTYYKTDHHWKTTTQLWAAGKIAEYVNDEFGFEFAPQYFDPSNYKITTYENCMLGSYGREVTLANCDLESFELIEPQFDTEIRLRIPGKGFDDIGSFGRVFLKLDSLKEIGQYAGTEWLSNICAYDISRIEHSAVLKINNLRGTDNDEKKILMLQDSMGNYLTSYLAMDIGEIDAIYRVQFHGSIRSFVEQERPDLVIILYCTGDVVPINWSSRSSYLDFR